MARRQKGTGSIFRQTGRGKNSPWLVQYYNAQGKQVIKSARTTSWTEAQKFLARILGEVANGETPAVEVTPRAGFTFEIAMRLFENDQITRGHVRVHQAREIVKKHLIPAFAGKRLEEITGIEISEYRRTRHDAGYAQATINGTLAILRKAFALAKANGYRGPIPPITTPNPKNAREGFFEEDQFRAVHHHLPEWWKDLATFAYYTGWRVQSEIAPLEWRHVDLARGVVTLDDSKNGEGRMYPFRMFPALAQCIAHRVAVREALRKKGILTARVFHREGRPLVDPPRGTRRTGDLEAIVMRAWHAACAKAGVPGRIPHDFRRTAVRNLIRAGLDPKTAMKLTGHKTMEVFHRYQIVNEHDLEQAVAQYAAAMTPVPSTSKTRGRTSRAPLRALQG